LLACCNAQNNFLTTSSSSYQYFKKNICDQLLIKMIAKLILSIITLFSLNLSFLYGYNSSCSAPIANSLLYNVDKYTAASVGLPNGSANESLSEAICCDVAYRNYAEPNGFFKFPDVRLFQVIDSKEVTIFYDSVCGIPLFQAPVGRTFADWRDDTTEHGIYVLQIYFIQLLDINYY
jgi:hypothetical protein